MLSILRRGHSGVQTVILGEAGWKPDPDVVWIDLSTPTREEELAVEAALGLDLPTPAEMQALEPSSRLYQEGGATFMTTTLLARSHEEIPFETPATFVLANGILITLRYEDLRAFTVFASRPHDQDATGAEVLLDLLDAIVERLAQVLDHTSHDVERASQAIFQRPQGGNFRPLLTELAHAQAVASRGRTSLVSLARLLSFAALAREIGDSPGCGAHLVSLQRDVQSLTEHTSHQSGHVGFLLDAALGLINIEQNGIIKFFSVVAVVFMPPTPVASIYGMNFDVMPELHWLFGYPMALAMMALVAVLPILWFKRRGWL